MFKYRIMFSIGGVAKFISHLDLNRLFERACRRAGLPLAFSQGFNPHPKISFAVPLAVGIAGEREFMEVELTTELEASEIQKRLNPKLPTGIKVLEVRQVKKKQKPLMARVERATYRFVCFPSFSINQQQAEQVINELLAKTSIEVERVTKGRTKRVDIRPRIFALAAQVKEKKLELWAELGVGNNGNVRPEELLTKINELGLPVDITCCCIYRTGLYSCDAQDKVELW